MLAIRRAIRRSGDGSAKPTTNPVVTSPAKVATRAAKAVRAAGASSTSRKTSACRFFPSSSFVASVMKKPLIPSGS
jgi:hypothetical protein